MRMRTGKRLLCMGAAWVLAVSLFACGGGIRPGQKEAETEKSAGKEAEESGAGLEGEPGDSRTMEEGKADLPPELETAPEDVDFQTGAWDGLTFSNPWLGLKVTLPEDSYIYTEEDMQAVAGAGQEILINGGNYTDLDMKIADAVTVYDFMASLPDGQSSIQLAYENVRLTTRGQGISAAEYLEVVWQQLASIGDIECKLEGTEETELGGKTFAKISVSLMGGAIYQDYYSMCKGSHMAVFTVSYLPESKAVAEEMMEGIRADYRRRSYGTDGRAVGDPAGADVPAG